MSQVELSEIEQKKIDALIKERACNQQIHQELLVNDPHEAELQLQLVSDEKWQYRKDDVDMLMTLIDSRSNIFMHGPNGSGKTTFVQDCFKIRRSQTHFIYIDTIELYSEKLIAISISQQINGILRSIANKLQLKKVLKKKFAFKTCKSFQIMLDAILHLQEYINQEIKAKNIHQFPQLELFNPFFYIVLDNIKSILKIERKKNIIEKLSIMQSLINSPSCFSIMVINDSLTDEIQIFKEHTNVFQEYMYTSFYFAAMNENQLKAILFESMTQAYGGNCPFLFHVYDNYFQQLHGFFSTYTKNINEYIYLFRFLYPRYIQKFYNKLDRYRKIHQNDEEQTKLMDIAKLIVDKPGAKLELWDTTFKAHLKEIQGSLYMHMSSMSDIEQEAKQKKEDEQVSKIQQNQKSAFNNAKNFSQFDKDEVFDYNQISYLKDFKKEINFSYMQSMILISAFIAGSNKESTDLRLFEVDRSKYRKRQGTNMDKAAQKGQQFMAGKTRRFSIDRLSAILDYITSLEIEGAQENGKINHSIEFYTCINSLVREELLKKQVMRTNGMTSAGGVCGGDELIAIGFKCNFDINFVQTIATKINFHIKEYMFNDSVEE